MQAKFYNFKKRILSTKRPTATGTAYDILLKAPTDIHNPTITIHATSFNFNYCYIAEFSTYYWVTGIRSLANGIWEVSLQNDAFASYKSDILASAGYVLYAAEDYDALVYDDRCAMFEINRDYTNAPLWNFNSTGVYVLRVIDGDEGSGNTFATAYLLTTEQVKALAAYFNDGNVDWDDFVKSVTNAFDCVIDLKWLPINLNDPKITPNWSNAYIWLGNHATGVQGQRLHADVTANGTVTIEIPWAYSDFRRYSPYSQLKLYIPYYGIVDVPTAEFVNKTTMECHYSIDCLSGDCTLQLGTLESNVFVPIFSFNYNVAVSLPISKYNSNIFGVMTSAVSLGGSAATLGAGLVSGNPAMVESGFGGVVGGAFNTWLAAQKTNATYKGSQQGFSWKDMPQSFYLICEYHETEDPDDYALVKGRPIMEYSGLQRFSGGFVQATNCNIEIDGLPGELDAINSALASGLFLE